MRCDLIGRKEGLAGGLSGLLFVAGSGIGRASTVELTGSQWGGLAWFVATLNQVVIQSARPDEAGHAGDIACERAQP